MKVGRSIHPSSLKERGVGVALREKHWFGEGMTQSWVTAEFVSPAEKRRETN
jgi:hypothetical protein